MKKVFYIIALLLLISACILIFISNKRVDANLIQSEYKTDIEPIVSRFTNIKQINATYWKSGEIGGTGGSKIFNIGPTNLWWRGYILLSEDEGKAIFDRYYWIECSEFDEEGNPKDKFYSIHGENTSPSITGLTNFNWFYSQEFYLENRPENFMGGVYFDKINNIIYFHLETD